MPLFKSIYIDPSSQILVWEITESFEELFGQVQLNEKSLERLNGMKSQLHQRAFLSVRKLLQEAGYNDFDLYYDSFGKPHINLNNDRTHPVEISISHSHIFSTIIISSQKIGIDIELQREKIIKIASKFCQAEYSFLDVNDIDNYIKKLTIIWGAKEAIFKIKNCQGISFKNHIQVFDFELNDKETSAVLELENEKQQFAIFFEEIESISAIPNETAQDCFNLVYAFEKPE